MSRATMIKSMRPLVHPSIDDITVEGILHALSDPVRVAIYAELAGSADATICSNFLQVSDRSIPISTLSELFRALWEAGLVRSERHEVEMRNVSRCKEIERRFPGSTAALLNANSGQAAGRAGDARRKPGAR